MIPDESRSWARHSGRLGRRPEFLALTLGVTAMMSQLLLLREAMAVFYGNEMVYAVILGCWLMGVGLGSLSFSRWRRAENGPRPVLAALLIGAGAGLPSVIIVLRVIRHVLHIPVGEIVNIPTVMMITAGAVMPLAFMLGGIYAVICRFREEGSSFGPGSPPPINRIYLFEAAGSALGGLVFSLWLVRILPALTIAALLALLQAVLALRVLTRRLRLFPFFLLLALAAGILAGGVQKLDDWSRNRQWKGFGILSVSDSVYGNLTLIQRGQEHTLFENGVLSFSTKAASSSEETVHLPLLSHPAPQDVLLIGSALDGSLTEVLKHPVRRVTQVDLDPWIRRIAEEHLPGEVLAPLRDSRVHSVFGDARLEMKRSRQTYDVILLNVADPLNAMLNRCYTKEFFQEAASRLNAGGVLSFKVSSSENYLNAEARAFLRSIHSTLRAVFPDVLSIPGDTNIFLASPHGGVLTEDPRVLLARLQERRIVSEYVREYYLPYKMSPDRMRYIQEILRTRGAINTDARPIAYFFNIVLWSSHFPGFSPSVFNSLQKIPVWSFLLIPVFLWGGGRLAARTSAAAPLQLSIWVTGISEIVFQIIVILAFQSLYGYAYFQIGFIMTAFMLGLAAGSLAAAREVTRPLPNQVRVYQRAQAAISFYPLLLPAVFWVFQKYGVPVHHGGVFAVTFSLLPVIAGFYGGIQYPLAVSLAQELSGTSPDVASEAGFLYALDVMGAALGAWITGAVLIPLYGIMPVAVLIAMMNTAVWLLIRTLRV
ncbi:MAG TPA: hypothetical protein PLT76_07345 [Candidatus Omnitrophota bacterium]|nr:hypothetical protein [Candidatus Omnitrophota bacterium]HQO58522.1 hypothetical protein [Candidatus Omnitrophota bacterium]